MSASTVKKAIVDLQHAGTETFFKNSNLGNTLTFAENLYEALLILEVIVFPHLCNSRIQTVG